MDRRAFIRNSALAGGAIASGLASAQEAARFTCIMFTKHLKGQSIDEMIASMKFVGSDGMDLAVRPGYPVNPDNCADALVPAVERIRAAGLEVPMVTSPGGLTTATESYARALFQACGDARIPLIKLGYWGAPEEDYWGAVSKLNDDLTGFVALGDEFGVKPCLHTHSGNNMFLNAAAMMHTLREFSPAQAGAYVDVGHLAVCGEPPPLALNMAAEWLSIVGMKDRDRIKRDDGSTTTRTVIMGAGFVDWKQTVDWLVKHNFAGPLTFHSEFPADSTEFLLEQTKRDFAYIRALEADAREA